MLLAAAVCALVLAACGGDDDSTTTGPAGTETSAQAPADGDGGDGNGDGGEGSGSQGDSGDGASADGNGSSSGDGGDGGGGDGGAGGGAGGSGDLGGPASFGPSKDPVPALEGERSHSFSHVGGDNSIQEYGEEVGAEDRAQATEALIALLRATESGDWSTVCARYLSSSNLEQFKILAEQSKEARGKGCPEILAAFTQNVPGRPPDSLRDSVASMRVEDEVGFAIYRGFDGKGYAMPMKREDGTWKLTALAPTPLEF